ncbi:MAG: S1 RNA-binding domain-containing protein [Firmicutes bacterium]|nr:S1 RNA-binding domain-containing protein [Bacillota bacterium]
MPVEVGAIIEGRVSGITKFGAFVDLENGQTGLVHISEIADTYVKDIHDFLQEGQDVKVKVINMSDGKIGLSIRQVYNDGPRFTRQSQKDFEEKLARFMKMSDERQADLKRGYDAKRKSGSRY